MKKNENSAADKNQKKAVSKATPPASKNESQGTENNTVSAATSTVKPKPGHGLADEGTVGTYEGER